MADQFVLFPTAKQTCTCCKAVRFCKGCCRKCSREDSCNSSHYETCPLITDEMCEQQEWINGLLVTYGGWKRIEQLSNEII